MRIPNLESTLTGTLAIAASYPVLGYFLPRHIQRINALYPSLTIELHELNRDAIEEGLISGQYDMAVLLTSNVSNPELALEPVIHSVRRLWVGAHHPLLKRGSVTFAEVAHEPFVMLTLDEAAQTAMRYWNATPWRPNVILRTSSVEAGGAQHGRQWFRRRHSVRNGLSAVVARRPTHRNDYASGPNSGYKRWSRVAQEQGAEPSDARGA